MSNAIITLLVLLLAACSGQVDSSQPSPCVVADAGIDSSSDAGAQQTYAVGNACECDGLPGTVQVLSGLMCLVTEPSRLACELPEVPHA
jgi:hypothetical protein